MGFYGNVTNVSRTQFQFDRIYSNRVEMERNKLSDGIFIGRHVLIEYDQNGLDSMKQVQFQNGKAYYNPKGDVSQQTLLTINNTNNPEVVYAVETDGSHSFYIYQGETLDQNAAKFTKVINDKNAPAYTINYNIDVAAYGAGRGYDSTAWQKVFSNEQESYIMIAELNTVVPTFDVAADAPTMNPIVPHFDIQSTDVYYKLHWQAPWGFRVAAANEAKSDVTTQWTTTTYNPATGKNETSEPTTENAAIYYNAKAFKAFGDEQGNITRHDDTTKNEIKVVPVSSGKEIFNDHDNPGKFIAAPDIQEMTINLPAIGNMMSDAWDIIHGPNRDDARTDTNSSLQGRLDSFKDLAKNSIPIKRASDGTIIGTTINGSTKANVSNILQEELSIAIDKDDAWIRTDVNSDNEANSISIHHTFTKTDDTISDSNVNDNKKDTIDLYTPIVDAAGHVVGKNTETITLPYGYKIIKTNGRGSSESENATGIPSAENIIAKNTQDELIINSGNKWIRIDTDTDNNSVIISHDIHDTSSTVSEKSLSSESEATAFEIPTYVFDKAGHYVSHDTKTLTMPFGYGKIKSDNGSTEASATYDELSFASDKWLTTTVTKDQVTYSHSYPEKKDDTTSEFDINNNGDTIVLETLERDEKGHVIKVDQNTVTLPYGYKTFSGDSGKTSADNTQDIMAVTGDNWITTTVSDDSIAFSHIGPVAITATKLDDITPKFGETFEITDWYYDEKGHKSSNNTHTVKIPKGSLTDAQSNQADVITQLSFVDSTGALSTIRTNISNLLLTDYSKKTNNEDISSTDALGDALSKLQTQIHDTETVIDALDYLEDVNNTKIITQITQVDGKITNVARAAAGTLELGSEYKISSEGGAITAQDSLNSAFGKIEKNLNDEKARAEQAEVSVLGEAKAYTDAAKKAILTGESTTELKEAYDTLVEIQAWIEGDGVNTTELTTAIAGESNRAKDEESRIEGLIIDEINNRTIITNELKSAAYKEESYFISKSQYDADMQTKDAQINGLNFEAKRLTNEVNALTIQIQELVDIIGSLQTRIDKLENSVE